MSTSREIFWSVLFASLSSAALPCDNPPLAAVPDPGGLSQEQRRTVQQEVGAYFEAMKAYTACLQAEIVAVSGDDGPRYRAALVNRNNAAVDEAQAVLKAFEKYVPVPANPGSETALGSLVNEYVQGKFDYDSMTPEVAADVRKIERMFRKQILSFGKFESVTFVSTNVLGADVYLVRFADGPMMWEIGLTPDGKISRSAMHVCMEGGTLVDPRSVRRCKLPDYAAFCANAANDINHICPAVRDSSEQRGVDGRETPPVFTDRLSP